MSPSEAVFFETEIPSSASETQSVTNVTFHSFADGTGLQLETMRPTTGSGVSSGSEASHTTIQRIAEDGSPLGPPSTLFSPSPWDAAFLEGPDGTLFVVADYYPLDAPPIRRLIPIDTNGAPISDEVALDLAAHPLVDHIGFLEDGRFYRIFQEGFGETAEIILETRASFESTDVTRTVLVHQADAQRLEGVFEAEDGSLVVHWLRDDDTFVPFDGKPDGPGPFPDGYGETRFLALTLSADALTPSDIIELTPTSPPSGAASASIVDILKSDDAYSIIWQHMYSDHESSAAYLQRATHGLDGSITGTPVELGWTGTQVQAFHLGSGLTVLGDTSFGSYYDPTIRVSLQVVDADGRFIGTAITVPGNNGANIVQTEDGLFVTGYALEAGTGRTTAHSRHLKCRPPLELTGDDDTHTLTASGFVLGMGGDDVLIGSDGNDILDGGQGNDTLLGGAGNDVLMAKGGSNFVDGGAGEDHLVLDTFAAAPEDRYTSADVLAGFTVGENVNVAPDGTITLEHNGETQEFRNIEILHFGYKSMEIGFRFFDQVFRGENIYERSSGVVLGGPSFDLLEGSDTNDTLRGLDGDDTLVGGLGSDHINGGDGDDYIHGASASEDLVDDRSDTVFAGSGDDTVLGGHGNDLVFGMGGNDQISGGFGTDELQGQDGDDVLSGGALSDLIFGNAGDDFINGGFGHDRINGGSGADRFYHLGIADHGSDWLQDYSAAHNDVLLFGQTDASAADFVVNFNHTTAPSGERAGDDTVQEAFVIYKPTEQIVWALIDGAGQDEINIGFAGSDDVFNLLL